jgi:hypothetical protein
MPFTFLSHQAVILPLKLARPRWLDGTALAIGSMAPDLEYFIRGGHFREWGHSLLGQVTFCLPVTLALTWLVRRVIAATLAPHLPDAGPFQLRDYALLAEKRPRLRDWLVTAACALAGSFSHIGWDAFTHENGRGVRALPILLEPAFRITGMEVEIFKLLQHGSTVVGGAATLAMLAYVGRQRLLRRWYRREPAAAVATPASRRLLWTPVLCAAVAAVTAVTILTPEDEWTHLSAWGNVLFRGVRLLFLGLLTGCLLARRAMQDATAD